MAPSKSRQQAKRKPLLENLPCIEFHYELWNRIRRCGCLLQRIGEDIKDKRAETVTRALTEQMRQLFAQLRKSLTWDRGVEMSAHRRFSMDTNMAIYFCDPGCP
ncbi:hypothetical protein CEY11_11085 [Candidimonas nitroreducens]|uniref:Integrase catalytic domain-containing protein n=1 Tax=Candidimonas nitroreducens TaxID=683354 RepID=A0A225MH45_9BURK|nr:hypothetical protein CEY11_11085 [Candidimonas nitroreducens]